MASFKNLVFISHPMVPGGIMAKYRFDNGKVLSVVAGEGLYSNPNTSIDSEADVTLFEVMFDDRVKGWSSRNDINQIFKDNE